MKRSVIAALSTILLLSLNGANAAEEKYVTIGTGGQTGVYYVVGQSICKLVNREQSKHGIKCTAPSTGGSVANLNAIRGWRAGHGCSSVRPTIQSAERRGRFRSGGTFQRNYARYSRCIPNPSPWWRAKTPASRPLMTSRQAVNIGNPGSGQRATMDALMKEKGWDTSIFNWPPN